MNRTKATCLLVATAALALLFSGCFGFAGLKFSKVKLSPGPERKSKTIATIQSMVLFNDQWKELWQQELGIPKRDYPFFLVGPVLGKDVRLNLLGGADRSFDTKGKFGPRGRALVRDDDLRDVVLADACADADYSPSSYVLVRTASRVNDRGELGTQTPSKLPLRQVSRYNDDDIPGLDIFAGAWGDDGDGIPESSDYFECLGGGFFNLAIRPANIKTARASLDRSAARERFGR